jgi:Uma2 family endonuclease
VAQTLEELKAEGVTVEVLELFPRQGKWTERYYFSLPETNKIVELSGGRLIITPAPTTEHQEISSKLHLLVGNFVLSNNLGKVCYSPLDVRLWSGTIRQPDIVFMSNEHKDRITERYWGVPDLVMEILSESTEGQDRTVKFCEYREAGVPEYWIVDPSRKAIEVFVLDQGAYKLLGKWGAGEVAHSRVLVGFQVAVDDVFGG